ncbi:MAG TPA: hypothetical protein VFX78_09695 [Candidatus Eisenbacteria bacterium]|jgi:hypothetical protein|nr:hypothetical protein [Candidatus Eisenbacteria bacterium]
MEPRPFRFYLSRTARLILAGVALVLAVVAGVRLWWRLDESYPLVQFERSRAAQEIVSLNLYAARERFGSLLPQGDAQIALREVFLRSVLERSLPIHRTFEDGRYEAVLTQASLDLRNGLALITLHGRARVLGQNASPVDAVLELQTHIDILEFRPGAGTLRAGLAVTGAHVVRAGTGMAQRFLNPAARFFGGLRIEDWNRDRFSLEIPIRLEEGITFPHLTGDVSLPERRISLAVGVSAFTVLENRLVLSLALEPDSASGEAHRAYRAEWIPFTDSSRAGMERQARRLYESGRGAAMRDTLLAKTLDLASHDPLWKGLIASDRDVVVVVPRPVLQTLFNRIARTYLQGARLDFDPDIHKHLDETLRVKLLGGKVEAGHIKGSLRVTHLVGHLRVTGDPEIRLLPPDGLEIAGPIQVQEGHGRVELDLEWDPKALVSVVCRGFEYADTLMGQVQPFTHMLRTTIRFAAADSSVAGRPVVQRDRLSLPVELTDSSFVSMREALVEQDKVLKCGMVMDPDSVMAKVGRLARTKIAFRLPAALFKPFTLPLSLEKEYEAGDVRIAASVRHPEVVMERDYLRFGFMAELAVRPAGQAMNEPRRP